MLTASRMQEMPWERMRLKRQVVRALLRWKASAAEALRLRTGVNLQVPISKTGNSAALELCMAWEALQELMQTESEQGMAWGQVALKRRPA